MAGLCADSLLGFSLEDLYKDLGFESLRGLEFRALGL